MPVNKCTDKPTGIILYVNNFLYAQQETPNFMLRKVHITHTHLCDIIQRTKGMDRTTSYHK